MDVAALQIRFISGKGSGPQARVNVVACTMKSETLQCASSRCLSPLHLFTELAGLWTLHTSFSDHL